MKKLLISLSSIVAILALAMVASVFLNQEPALGADAFDQVTTYCNDTAATTTLSYLTTSSASSTCFVKVAGADSVDVKWIMNASTTASRMQYVVYFADEEGNARTWYPENNFISTISAVTYTPRKVLRNFTPGIAGTTYHNQEVANINDRWMKVEYKLTGANAGVNLEVLTKNKSTLY